MNFKLEVGNKEKHLIEFNFNLFWGSLYIKVDNRRIIKDFEIYSLKLIRTYEFEVGVKEKHIIRIEMQRKLFFACFRKRHYKVYLDNNLIKEYEGY